MKKLWTTLFITLATLAVLAIPLAPLLLVHASFDGDWYSHIWFIGHMGKYFAAHHSVTGITNASETIGLPTTLFYGNTLYPVLALFSSMMSPQLSVRLAVLLLCTFQLWLVFRLLLVLTSEKTVSFFTACLVSWATYPLTNLYNRAAIPEFFATGAFVCGLACLFLLLLSKSFRQRLQNSILGGLFMALALGSHPITTLYGGLFLTAIGCALFLPLTQDRAEERGSLLIWTLGAGLFTIICISPWVYVTGEFIKQLPAAHMELTFYPNDIDTLWTRFQLFPFDKRSLLRGQEAETCYLDAQINMALLIFLLGTGFLERTAIFHAWKRARSSLKSLFFIAAASFALTSWMSLSPTPYRFLPESFKVGQIGYRLITYQNLSLVVGLLALVLVLPETFRSFSESRGRFALLSGCGVLALTGVMIKYTHAMAARDPAPRPDFSYVHLTKGYLGQYQKFLTQEIPPLGTAPGGSLQFAVDDGASFGSPLAADVTLEQSTWLKTNVVTFPWNQLMIDARAVGPDELRRDGEYLSILVPAGHHSVDFVFKPSTMWLWLKTISFIAALLGALALLINLLGARSSSDRFGEQSGYTAR